MRIAILSATFPPDVCGVGDHTAELSREWVRQGHQVSVWTAHSNLAAYAGIELHPVPRPWSPSRLSSLTCKLELWRPDRVFLKYTPNLIAPKTRGVHPILPLWYQTLQTRLRCRTVLLAHELHYPIQPNPRGILLGIPQFLQCLALALAADQTILTYEAARNKLAGYLPWRRQSFRWLPVGSNISPPSPESAVPRDLTPAERLTLLGRLSAGTKFSAEALSSRAVLLHFGGMHPTHLLGHMLAALQKLEAEQPGRAMLVFAGPEHEAVEQQVQQLGLGRLLPSIRGLGYLPADDLSQWLRLSTLILAPFMDGISTRRGSAMAGFAHARPVATTRSCSTDPSIPWDSFCGIAPAGNAESYALMVSELLKSPERLANLGTAGKQYYEQHFSWPVIARQILAS